MTGKPHRPADHLGLGCLIGMFALVWTVAVLVIGRLELGPTATLFASAERFARALLNLTFLAPFVYAAVALWAFVAAKVRLAFPRPGGLAATRRTPTGWVAVCPNPTGWVAAGAVLATLVFFVRAPLDAVFGPPIPVWACILVPVAAASVAVRVYRRVGYWPTVEVDETARTVSLPRGRRAPPLVVPWGAVAGIEVVEAGGEEGSDFECRVNVHTANGLVTVGIDPGAGHWPGAEARWPAERLAEWLRERTQPESGA